MSVRAPGDLHSTADVARLLGLSEARIRSFVRSGLCRPGRRGRAYVFDFRDLVVLHAARRLLREGVPPARVRRALRALARELPEGESLSGLQLDARHGAVTVRSDGATWDAETGQTHLRFEPVEGPPHEDPRAADGGRESRELRGAVGAPRPGAAPSSGAQVVELRARDVEVLVDEFRAAESPHAESEAALLRALSLEEVDPKAAAEAYRSALALDPDLADALINLGRLHHDAGELGEALELYERALERDPIDPIVHFNRALAQHDALGAAAAVESYQRALELDPEFADAHFNLAQVFEQLGQEADALRHYRAYQRLTEG